MERIDAVAVEFDGAIWTLPAPARHHQVIAAHVEATGLRGSGRQGFLTSSGRFVDREEAARIAHVAGQLPRAKRALYSEDLW